MQVKEIMTSNVACVRPDDTIQQAARQMRDLDVGPLPVCGDDDRLAGMITDRDIVVRAIAEGRDPKTTPVSEAMTDNIIFCFDGDDVEDAGRTMRERQVRRLVVLNADKRMVGIVALADLATDTGDREGLGEVLEGVSEPPTPEP